MSIPLTRETVLPTQCMARALYDNIAESPDELAFRRGDLLTVLEQNTGGSEGWWLCSLRGRQGICPGNRLRIVAGVFDASSALQRRRTRTPAPVAHQPLPTQQSPAFTKIEECSHYDVPRAPMPVQRIVGTYDCPRQQTDWYDAPRAPRPASADSACSGTGSLTSATSSASGNSGSSANSAHSASSTYDVPRSRALPLPCDAAMEALERLQEEASTAVSRLLSYVTPGWRRRGALRPRVLDVRVAGARLRAALHDLAVFADATLANAHDAQDKGIAVKLRPLVKALKDAERITHEATSALDAGDWAAERLEREREPTDGTHDALDQLVACARSLTEDVRRAASFIHGNASLLFRRSATVPEHEWTEEYDYVRLESRTAVGRRNAEIRAALPDKLRASFDALVRDADHAGEDASTAGERSGGGDAPAGGRPAAGRVLRRADGDLRRAPRHRRGRLPAHRGHGPAARRVPRSREVRRAQRAQDRACGGYGAQERPTFRTEIENPKVFGRVIGRASGDRGQDQSRGVTVPLRGRCRRHGRVGSDLGGQGSGAAAGARPSGGAPSGRDPRHHGAALLHRDASDSPHSHRRDSPRLIIRPRRKAYVPRLTCALWPASTVG